MLRLIKSNFRNFNNLIGHYNFKGLEANKNFVISNTVNKNFKLKFFSTLILNDNSSRQSSSSSSSSSSSDEDFQIDTNSLKKVAMEIELHDKSILNSQDFKKYFSITDVGEIFHQKEDNGQDTNIFVDESRESWISALKNIEDTQNKLKVFLEIIEKQIFIKLRTNNMLKVFKLEDIQKFTPNFLLKSEIKLSINEIKFLLLNSVVLLTLGDNINYRKYEPIISDYINFYFKNLDNTEIISIQDFMFLLKMNSSLKFEKLDDLLMSGLHLIFKKSYDENSFKNFINNNTEYKDILKYFPLFSEYFSRLYLLHNDRFKYILENIVESMMNLTKYYANDIRLLSTITEYTNKIVIQYKDNLTNYRSFVLVLHEEYKKVQLKDIDNFIPFMVLTINYFQIIPFHKLEIEKFEPVFEKLREALVIHSKSYLPREFLFKMIQSFSSFIISILQNKNEELGLKVKEHIKIILNQIYERWDYQKNSYEDLKYLEICLILRSLIYVSTNKPNKSTAKMVLNLTEDFKNKVDLAESPLELIDTLYNCRKIISSEEKQIIFKKILNRIFSLKNQNFHVFNNYLATLFSLHVNKNNIISNLKIDYMNKLYFANLTGQLFTTDLNLNSLLENLRNFSCKHIIQESVMNKRNLSFSFNDSNLIYDEEMEEIKQGRHTLSENDIGNLLDRICLHLLENKIKIYETSTKLILIDNIYFLTSNSLNRDYLFDKYYHSVLYPLISMNLVNKIIFSFKPAIDSLEIIIGITNNICNLENPTKVMPYHLKLICRNLVIAIKFSNNQREENNKILFNLNTFYKLYVMNPYYFEEVERNNKKFVFLRFILRKRFLIGRKLNGDGPVKIFKGKDKIVSNKTNELTDNYFFG